MGQHLSKFSAISSLGKALSLDPVQCLLHSRHLSQIPLFSQLVKALPWKAKRYCDRKCANASSVDKHRERLQQEKRKKVMAAYRELAKLTSAPENKKKWVAMTSGVDQRWITRNLNAGKLPPSPTRGFRSVWDGDGNPNTTLGPYLFIFSLFLAREGLLLIFCWA